MEGLFLLDFLKTPFSGNQSKKYCRCSGSLVAMVITQLTTLHIGSINDKLTSNQAMTSTHTPEKTKTLYSCTFVAACWYKKRTFSKNIFKLFAKGLLVAKKPLGI